MPVYTDILATSSIKEFTECFGKSLLTAMAKNEPVTRRILRALSSLRPKLGIDPLTGEPSLSFIIGNEREALDSLDLLFRQVSSTRSSLP